jgi:hypothetical protein
VRGHSTWVVLEANRCSEKVGSSERDGMEGNWKSKSTTYLFFARPKTGDWGLNPDHGLRSIKITIAV